MLTTVLLLDVNLQGFGYGTLDGNGQVWYDFVNGTNNYPGRPHQITFEGMEGGSVKGVRFVQSQMWYVSKHLQRPLRCGGS